MQNFVPLLVLILLATALRLFVGLEQEVVPTSDFDSYFRTAKAFAEEGTIDVYFLYKGPATNFVYGVWYWLFGATFLSTLMFNVLLLTPLSLLMLDRASAEVTKGSNWRLVAVLAWVVYPPAIDLVCLPASENIQAVTMPLFIWGILRSLRLRTLVSGIIGGLALGVALFVKGTYLLATPFIFFVHFLTFDSRFPFFHLREGPRSRAFWQASLVAVFTVLVLAPWTIYASARTGRLVFTATYGPLIFYCAHNPFGADKYMEAVRKRDEVIPDFDKDAYNRMDYSQVFQHAIRYLGHDPGSILRDLPQKFGQHWGYHDEMRHWVQAGRKDTQHQKLSPSIFGTAIHFIIMYLVLVGLFVPWAHTCRGQKGLLGFLFVYGNVLIPLVLLLATERLRLPHMLLNLVIMAAGCRAVADRSLRFGHGRTWIDLIGPPLWLCRAPIRFLSLLRKTFQNVFQRYSSARIAIFVGLVILIGCFAPVTYRMLHDRSRIELSALDFEQATFQVYRDPPIAVPHPVIGPPSKPPPAENLYARYRLFAERSGSYRLDALYSAKVPHGLDVFVNDQIAIRDAFKEAFGGAPNTFANWRSQGDLQLREGKNVIELRGRQPQKVPGGQTAGPFIERLRFQFLSQGEDFRKELRSEALPGETVHFVEPLNENHIAWVYRTQTSLKFSSDGGVRCDIQGGHDQSGGQYGGIRFNTQGFTAMYLDVSFIAPENIESIFVDGIDRNGQKIMRWHWDVQPENSPHGRGLYAFVPG